MIFIPVSAWSITFVGPLRFWTQQCLLSIWLVMAVSHLILYSTTSLKTDERNWFKEDIPWCFVTSKHLIITIIITYSLGYGSLL